MRSELLTYRDRAGRVADFLTLRHSFLTNLANAGDMTKDAKELARHSAIVLNKER